MEATGLSADQNPRIAGQAIQKEMIVYGRIAMIGSVTNRWIRETAGFLFLDRMVECMHMTLRVSNSPIGRREAPNVPAKATEAPAGLALGYPLECYW
jgi:hypothetical protein